jgi:hypothetical protein
VGARRAERRCRAEEPNIASLMLDDESVIWARLDGVIRRVAKP